jgi:hypothetical protein
MIFFSFEEVIVFVTENVQNITHKKRLIGICRMSGA